MSDLISREKALEEIEDWERCYTWDEHCRESKEDYIVSPSDVIVNLPSAQPERPEQPESAREYCAECDHIEMCQWYPYEGCEFRSLPSAQPEEIALHESCTDCPLYDKNRHSCPRFNRVIPEVLREVMAERRQDERH